MARSSVHTFTKLVDEPWFIECRDNLRGPRSNPVQAATITEILSVRLERRVTADPETWEVVSGLTFSSLQILDDGAWPDSMIGGIIDADPDADPAPSEDLMIVALCSIQFLAAFGGGVAEKAFRRRARIPASALTAPAS